MTTEARAKTPEVVSELPTGGGSGHSDANGGLIPPTFLRSPVYSREPVEEEANGRYGVATSFSGSKVIVGFGPSPANTGLTEASNHASKSACVSHTSTTRQPPGTGPFV